MKKYLLFLFLLCSYVANAQILKYRSQQFAIADVNIYTGRYTWSQWQPSNIIIYIDFTNNEIYINTEKKQYYKIISYGQWEYDNNEGKTLAIKFIDQDYDKGICHLRIESNGNSQIYIDFNNIAWCYSGLIRLN